MSNPTTKFLVGGLDLSSIFQPLSLGTPYGTATGYKIPNGEDLNQIFAVYPGSGTKANTTGYQIGANDLCNIFAKYNPSPPFTTTGTVQTEYISNYYIVTFDSSGSITFNSSISNASIICVGGGGGGGAGISTGTSPFGVTDSGRGGGGGGNYQITNVNLTTGTYITNIGLGGKGGTNWSSDYQGGTGQTSLVKNPSSTTIISCSGGGGGGSGGQTNKNPGIGGNVLLPVSSGGSGGDGGDEGSNGFDSSSNTTPFIIPSAISSYIKSSYSGGGGGSDEGFNGGGSGFNGTGGILEGSSNRNGANATTPGSGGGGAGNNSPLYSSTNYLGGNGANGIIIFYFQYV